MIKTDDFVPRCGCRSVGECRHGMFAEWSALDAMVDQFSDAIKKKLHSQIMRGWSRWDDAEMITNIAENLKGQMQKETYDYVDIGGLAAMLYNQERP